MVVSPDRKPIRSLQGVRAVAALMVATYHLSVFRNGVDFRTDWLVSGRLGVDVFFVLSGFIILYAHAHDTGRPAALPTYALKRFIRIYPIYWVVTGLLALQAARAGELPASALDWVSALTLVRFSGYGTLVDVSWSLYHEIIFYAAFASLIIDVRLGIAVFACWFGTVALTHQFFEWGDWGFHQTALGFYNIDFLFGMTVFVASRRLTGRAIGCAAAASVALLIGLIAFEHANGQVLPLRLFYGIGFAGVVLGIVRADVDGLIWTPASLILVGDASYVLYLTHLPVMRLLRHLGKHVSPALTASYWVAIPIVTIAAIAIHLAVEKPLLRACRAALSRLGLSNANSRQGDGVSTAVGSQSASLSS